MEFNHVKSYRQNHPNPQFLRENYESLNGYWKFAFDEDDIGLLNHYELKFPKEFYQILVPFSYQSEINKKNIPYKQCDVIWYEKEIYIDSVKDNYLLKFFGCDYLTEVFVNGIYCGTNIGAYTEFDFDISKALVLGNNKITLRIVDKMLSNQLRGKQRWKKDNFTCFYKEFSGIYKDVILEKVNKNYILNFQIKGNYLESSINLNINVKNDKFDFIKFIVSDREIEVSKEYIIEKTKLNSTLKFNCPKPWDNDNPFLYDVTIQC